MAGRIALIGPLIAAGWFAWFDIGRVGLGNVYYATAVQSMLSGPHELLFVSFDPAGFVGVDKPPLGLWFQAASAALFGFAGPALILPSALASVVSVGLLGAAVRGASGRAAGFVAAGALAVTPVSVVVARDNILDGPLVALVLGAALATLFATRSPRVWPLPLAALLVGLAFNVKFLEAYLVVPALTLLYLLAAPGGWRQRASALALSGAVLLLVSVAWLAFVDLTPADQRPYVGSTRTNSAFELAFGYDGLQRLLGRAGPVATEAVEPAEPAEAVGTDPAVGTNPAAGAAITSNTPPSDPTAGDAGMPGLFRLLEAPLGGQVGWFLPLALVGLAAGLVRLPWSAWRRGRRPTLSRGQASTVLWGGWFMTAATFFSVARFISPYYLAVIAPPIAALSANGAVIAWRSHRQAGPMAWLLPVALMATGVEAWTILLAQPGWLPWLGPFVLLAAATVSLGLWLGLARRAHGGSAGPPLTGLDRSLQVSIALVIAVVFCAAPALWTLDSFRAPDEGGHPLSGPARTGNPTAVAPSVSTHLERYLLDNAGSSRFLVATLDTSTATPFILATGRAAMALGGYGGHDPILTTVALAADVAAGVVRYVYLPTGDLTTDEQYALYPDLIAPVVGRNDGPLARWVAATCAQLPPSIWSTATVRTTHALGHELFDCAPRR